MDTELASGTGEAFGAATIIDQAQQTLFRVAGGGYARISTATQLWGDEGETMPGIDRHNTMIPFLPTGYSTSDGSEFDILVRGGRSFIKDIYVSTNGVATDISDAEFVSQIRKFEYAKYPVVQFICTIIDGPTGHLRIKLTPEQTDYMAHVMFHGVWDLEMQLDGEEYTVVPQSKVEVEPGISQGTMIGAGVSNALGAALDGDT